MIWILALGLPLLTLLAVLVHYRVYLWQYVFFCRFPLLIGLVLAIGLPAGMEFWARNMLGNLAVLNPYGVASVAMLATLTAWTVVLVTARMLSWVPRFADLPFERKAPYTPPIRLFAWIQGWATQAVLWLYSIVRGDLGSTKPQWQRLLYSLVLVAPLLIVVVARSTTETSWHPNKTVLLFINLTAALIGIAVAVLIRVFGAFLTERFGWLLSRVRFVSRTSEAAHEEVSKFVQRFESERASPETVDTEDSRSSFITSLTQSAGFFLVAFIVYIAGRYLLDPANPWPAPALLIVLMLLLLLTFLTTTLSGLLDKARVLVLAAVAIVAFASFFVFNIDHHYETPEIPRTVMERSQSPFTPVDAYSMWRTKHPASEYPVPVVVTVSGGGITASRWTAEVLTRIQRAVPAFGDSLLVVSSVSGGGVGAMYFIDAYSCGSPPSEEALPEIKLKAGTSSLLATTWGFAYRDILWSVPLFDRTQDRGWALEQNWKRLLEEPEATLRERQTACEGDWRPIQVFNATAAETGERFLLSPLSRTTPIDPSSEEHPVASTSAGTTLNFLDLYRSADLKVSTAARLSAAFPFVSPIARPEPGLVPENLAYHLADGGYYDNHGVATAVEFMRDVLPTVAAESHPAASPEDEVVDSENPGPPPKLLMIQVRVAPREREPSKPRSGFKFTTIGPITTLLKVRTASQVARNTLEVSLLQEAWSDRVTIQSELFEFSGLGAPLSWHLTHNDKVAIRDAWTADHEAALERIRHTLTGEVQH